MRYTKNTTESDCGAVVIANAIKWSGKKYSYADNKKHLAKKMKLRSWGIFPEDFDDFIMENKFPFTVKKLLTFQSKRLYKHLRAGGAIILGTSYNDGGHVSLIIGETKRCYKIVNWDSVRTIQYIKKTYINRYLQLCYWKVAYLITK